MKMVYVLMERVDCEGDSLVDIYDNEREANIAAEDGNRAARREFRYGNKFIVEPKRVREKAEISVMEAEYGPRSG